MTTKMTHAIVHLLVSTLERVYVVVQKERKMFTLTSYNFVCVDFEFEKFKGNRRDMQ
jgi:hypothetical protein